MEIKKIHSKLHAFSKTGKAGNKGAEIIKLIILFAVIMSISGCGLSKQRIYMNPDADIPYYEKVGIIPFKSLGGDREAGEKVSEVFMTELLITQKLQVADPGDFYDVLSTTIQRSAVGGALLNHKQLKSVHEKTGVQGVIEGVIHTLEMVRIGQDQYPMISLTIRLLDAQTGTIVWQSSYTRQGGPRMPIFSVGETFTIGKLTQQACRDIVEKLIEEMSKE